MKKIEKLKYAMVGGGIDSFIGPIHRMALRMDDLAELTAGCFSRNPKKNRECIERFRLAPDRVYSDWRELIAAEHDRVDFLVIATTNETHYEIAKVALSAGMDVFCEKPLSLTAKEAQDLQTIASRRHRILGVPFTYTGFPMVKLARDIVRRGELGNIDRVTIEYVQGSFRKPDRRTSWKTNPKIAGPSCVVADIGVHAFTLVELVTGLTATSVLADLSSFSNSRGLDDDATILMRLKGGAKATIITSKVATGEENGLRLRVYGDKASLFWDQESPNYLRVKYPMAPERIYKRNAPYICELSAGSLAASRFPAGHHEGFGEALANIYDEFTSAVRTRKRRDFTSGVEGVRSMRFVDAVLKSDRTGNRWVKV